MDTTFQLQTTPSDVKRYYSQLKGCHCEDLRVAIIGKASGDWACAIVAAGLCDALILPLDETLQIHQYKRILNQYRCNCLIFSPEFDALAYMLQNTGTTTVCCYIRLQEAAGSPAHED